MKHNRFTMVVLFAGISLNSYAQHDDHHNKAKEEEVFVISSPLSRSASETALPVTTVDGEKLRESVSNTLGESLKSVPGINSASFGPGVGNPVVRGQTGNRVRVLSNGLGTADASTVSGDHANSVDPLVATGVEIIKGPATLLYGSGAIGGVVNVLDNRIPSKPVEKTKFGLEQKHDTADDGNSTVLVLDSGTESFAWHIDASHKNTNNVSIPGFAILEDEEEEGVEEEEEENTFGFIENSDLETSSINLGGSLIWDEDYVGLSIGYIEKEYGLPPGAHGHEEEGDALLDPVIGGEEEEEEDVLVRIDMEEIRADLKGKFHFDGFWNSFAFHLSSIDYEHMEIEIEDEHGEEEPGAGLEEEEEEPTVFSNDAFVSRFELVHGEDKLSSGWHGALGLEVNVSEFVAEGIEAFIPRSDIESLAIFYVESLTITDWIFEFGARAETQSIEPGNCGEDHNSLSLSAASIWKFSETTNLSVGISRSSRAPSVEELFSNIDTDTCELPVDDSDLVEHAATGLFERGDPDLDNEISHNIEVGIKKHKGDLHGEFNVYYNEISDYIFLLETEEEIADYLQSDASFTGFEFEGHYVINLDGDSHFDIKLLADAVFAELDEGGNLPRIPPWRFGVELAYLAKDWVIRVNATQAGEQDEVAEEETPTDGYTDLSIYGDYHWDFGDTSLVAFAKGTNLLDEEIRLHTSFVKDFSPEPGIGFELGLRLNIN